MVVKLSPNETRTPEQLRQHYEVEKELASRLRKSSAQERRGLYTSLYDELYRRVPLHPRLTRKHDAAAAAAFVARAMRLLHRFLKPDSTYLEIGAGDCGLALQVAQQVNRVYALEVSHEAVRHVSRPSNLDLIFSDGTSVPVPAGSVTVAYSNQVMEHVHPEDAVEQLRNIDKALAPGGVYVCVTPNRTSGPHDISMYFDTVATGFHMHEYTVGELRDLLIRAGFSKVRAYVGIRQKYFRMPLHVIRALELLLLSLPSGIRRSIGSAPLIANVLFITLVATK